MALKKIRIYLSPNGWANSDGRFYVITKTVNTVKYQVGEKVDHKFVEALCTRRDCEVIISMGKVK